MNTRKLFMGTSALCSMVRPFKELNSTWFPIRSCDFQTPETKGNSLSGWIASLYESWISTVSSFCFSGGADEIWTAVP